MQLVKGLEKWPIDLWIETNAHLQTLKQMKINWIPFFIQSFQ